MRSAKIIFLLIAVAALGAALWWARDYYPYIFLLLGFLAALFVFYFRRFISSDCARILRKRIHEDGLFCWIFMRWNTCDANRIYSV